MSTVDAMRPPDDELRDKLAGRPTSAGVAECKCDGGGELPSGWPCICQALADRGMEDREPPMTATEVGGLEFNAADLQDHPAACPPYVTGKLRQAALTLGLSIRVGAERPQSHAMRYGHPARPRDGTWVRYIEVTDERLPEKFRLQRTDLNTWESWEDAAKRLGLWPTH